jgi:chaperonin GroEL
LVNAGKDAIDAQMIGRYQLVEIGDNKWAGYDIKTETIVDMKKEGIIDPTKVTRTALENAASVAGTVLLTECIVVDEPKKENNSPQIDPSMMMGM